jgi:hypothetical protein
MVNNSSLCAISDVSAKFSTETSLLTEAHLSEKKRLDESACDSILHEFSNLFDQMLKDK